MTSILQCPVCRNPLLPTAGGYHCSQNHSFDAGREGYVNLLLAHKKNSREPGDGKEMIRSRRRFLDLGLYDGISDGLNEAVADVFSAPGREGAATFLDAGCGEGYYLRRLKAFLAGRRETPAVARCYGVDISKFAVRQAAQRDRTTAWLVASIVDLPFASSSLDIILNVFSPAAVPEFARVLGKTGWLVTASPGPRHLKGLRELIYDEAREHRPAAIADEAKAFFKLHAERRVAYRIELNSREAILDLLAMTPYYWSIGLKAKAGVEALNRLSLDVDVEIRVFRKGRG